MTSIQVASIFGVVCIVKQMDFVAMNMERISQAIHRREDDDVTAAGALPQARGSAAHLNTGRQVVRPRGLFGLLARRHEAPSLATSPRVVEDSRPIVSFSQERVIADSIVRSMFG